MGANRKSEFTEFRRPKASGAVTDFGSGVRSLRFIYLKLTLLAVMIVACAAGFIGTRPTSAQETTSSCIKCHSQLEQSLSDPVHLFDNDIHKSKGLSCSDCHGGNPNKDDKAGAKDPNWGYIAKPTAQQIPGFCGKCHSDASLMKKFNPSLRVDQVQEYYTSVHGTRLKNGDINVATCVSCHGSHGIRPPDDPQSTIFAMNVAETCAKCHANAECMKGYPIPHDQYDKYKSSVHAKALYDKHDLSAPTCNDCHGNHGAAPRGLTSVANVCGQCHSRQGELFQNSPHKVPFDNLKVGECIRCHSNHEIKPPTDAMAGVGEGSVCSSCHNNDKGFAAAQRIGGGIETLQRNITDATDKLDRAERAGMEVSKPKFELSDASGALTQARVLVHSTSPDEVEKVLAPGMEIAAKSLQTGDDAFAELLYRRKGLIVSLIFILFLASLVYLKVRQIEGKSPFTKV